MFSFRILPILLLLSLIPGVIAAQPSGSLSSFGFLQLDASARANALGGAFSAVSDGDVNGLFYNPALPSPATSQSVTVSYLNHLSDANAGTFGYSHPMGLLGTTVSGGLRYVDWSTVDREELPGTAEEREAILTMGASRLLGARTRSGVNLHLLHAQADQARATVLAADVGAVYRIPTHRLALGGVLRHLSVMLDRFEREQRDLPLDLHLGLSKHVTQLPILLSITAYDLLRPDEEVDHQSSFDRVLSHLVFGGELQLGEVLHFRLGYNHRRNQELAFANQFDLVGVSMGFGLDVGQIAVDYAYSSWSDLGAQHQFTLRADLAEL